MKLINRITIQLLSTTKLSRNKHYFKWSNNFHHQFDFLNRSYYVFERKRFSSIVITKHENLINNIKEYEINDLSTLNEEELLWKLKLYLFTKKDVEDFWKILQVYMRNMEDIGDMRNMRDMKSIKKNMRKMKEIKEMKKSMREMNDDLILSKSNNLSLSMKYISLIFTRLFKNDKDDQKSVLFWEMLKKLNVKLDSNCYNIILQNSFLSEYFTHNLRKIFDEMKILGYKPTMFTLKSMMRDYSKLGKMKYVKRFNIIYLKLNY